MMEPPVPDSALSILHVTSEAYPFSKSGGLADVAAALPQALSELGMTSVVLSPLYPCVRRAGIELSPATDLKLLLDGAHVALWEARHGGVRHLFVEHPEFFDRSGLYGGAVGDYADNFQRFHFLGRVAAALAGEDSLAADVLHAHDWQGAFAVLEANRHDTALATVLTVHNLAFQGVFSRAEFASVGFPEAWWNMHMAEFYGRFNVLKTAMALADRVTTVSPTYAGEILTSEFGCGLEGALAGLGDRLRGIRNGADYDAWSPERDPHLPAVFTRHDLSGKKACRAALREAFGLEHGDLPVLGVVSRLASQKGIDLLAEALAPYLAGKELQLAVLGMGDPSLESVLEELARAYPGRASLLRAYDETLAHRVVAGADVLLIPSRFEPCGLTQMYAMRYGTLPLASAVGGLADTITPYPQPGATGFLMDDPGATHLELAVCRMLAVWNKPEQWRTLVDTAMARDLSWREPAAEYAGLYREIIQA